MQTLALMVDKDRGTRYLSTEKLEQATIQFLIEKWDEKQMREIIKDGQIDRAIVYGTATKGVFDKIIMELVDNVPEVWIVIDDIYDIPDYEMEGLLCKWLDADVRIILKQYAWILI